MKKMTALLAPAVLAGSLSVLLPGTAHAEPVPTAVYVDKPVVVDGAPQPIVMRRGTELVVHNETGTGVTYRLECGTYLMSSQYLGWLGTGLFSTGERSGVVSLQLPNTCHLYGLFGVEVATLYLAT
jgi:hypothetical protein